MGMTTFTGPITAGDVLDTTGTTVGSIKNVGYVEMSQAVNITQATNGSVAGLYTTDIVIPAGSMITEVHVFVKTAWDGVASTFNVGTSATATELAVTQAGGTVGQVEVSAGTSATRVANWLDVGTSDVRIYILSTNTGNGVGAIVVNYIQALNLTP